MESNLVTIAGHTFDESLLTDGVIIDVGCRGFEFANYFTGKTVYCIDPDEKVFNGKTAINVVNHNDNGMVYLNVAISDKIGETTYYENGEATMIREIDPDPTYPHINEKYSKKCATITMGEIYHEIRYIHGAANVDLLKLDCEGAEYIILGETFVPIPKQITVEFHHHCVPDLHKQHYQSIVERLSKDYTMHNDVWEQRHGCGFNFWDTLFIRKW